MTPEPADPLDKLRELSDAEVREIIWRFDEICEERDIRMFKLGMRAMQARLEQVRKRGHSDDCPASWEPCRACRCHQSRSRAMRCKVDPSAFSNSITDTPTAGSGK